MMIVFYLFGMLMIMSNLSDSQIIQAKYHRYFDDKIINLGTTNLIENVTLRSCGFLCRKFKQCAGFHFEKNEQTNTACKLQIAKADEFPKSFFYKANSNYYGRHQNHLKAKDATGCAPIDPSVTYYCDKAPSTQQSSMSCQVQYGDQSTSYFIQTAYKVKSAAAQLTCSAKDSKLSVARISDKRIQDWFCNIVTAFCGATTKRAFTIGLYRESATSNWRYGSKSRDLGAAPAIFYQNWFNDKDGIDDDGKLCVQMLSGAPYYFKWKLASCDNGTIAYPICETVTG